MPPVDPATSEATSMSLTDRLTDIFFSPGAVFDSIKLGPPKVINWILPMLLAIVVGAVAAIVMFSQPGVIQQIRQSQAKQYEKMIKQGKLTEQQAADIQEKSEKFTGPKFLQIASAVAVVFVVPIRLFAIALVAWLLGRFAFKGKMDYLQALEVVGISSIISILGGLVATFLISSFGDMMATTNPTLFIDHRDITNKVHMMLSKFDLFELWFLGLVSHGIARLSGTQWFKPAICIFGIWALLTIGPVWIF